MQKKLILISVILILISTIIGTTSLAKSGDPVWNIATEGASQYAQVGDTGTGENKPVSEGKDGNDTKPTDGTGSKKVRVHYTNERPNVSDMDNDIRRTNKQKSETYGFFWYIYDLNDKSTEAKPQLIRDSTDFKHTFNEVGNYRVEKYTVKLVYDWTQEKEYEPYVKTSIDYEDESDERVKRVSYELRWRLIDTRDIKSVSSKTSPQTKNLKASNGEFLGKVSANKPMQLDDGKIYPNITMDKSTWTVIVTDPPQTWKEGDGNTKIGDPPEIDVELVE